MCLALKIKTFTCDIACNINNAQQCRTDIPMTKLSAFDKVFSKLLQYV